MKDKKLLIIGASGHGKVLADIATLMGEWIEISFLDDDVSKESLNGFQIIGTSKDIEKYLNDYEMVIGIGSNQIRKRVTEKLEEYNAKVAVLIHPHSIIARDVEIGKGTVVMAGVIINPATTIGKGCIINTSSSVDHDNIIADFVHISPGVHTAGGVFIGEETWLGIGSVVNNNTSIIENSIVGSGAVVTKDITIQGTYVGVPARRLG